MLGAFLPEAFLLGALLPGAFLPEAFLLGAFLPGAFLLVSLFVVWPMSVGGLSILSILQKPPIEEGKFVASFLGGGGKLATRREMQG